MDVPDLFITWSHTYTSDDIVEVPGFHTSLASVASAGVYVQVALTPKGDELRLTVGASCTDSWSVMGFKNIIYKITDILRAFWLVKNLSFIAPVKTVNKWFPIRENYRTQNTRKPIMSSFGFHWLRYQ